MARPGRDPGLTWERSSEPRPRRPSRPNVAVDAVFDSVSIATTFKEKLREAGVIFCSISEAVQEHPGAGAALPGQRGAQGRQLLRGLNSAVFSDGSFVYVPEGVRCPMELSTYFRINAQNTGQFERTLIVADKGAYVSYLEGCTAPMRDENQLHAAVVELVALEDAEIKYSTVQNWYPGDAEGKGGIYNFVTKRGLCRGDRVEDLLDPGGDRLGHHLEIPERGAARHDSVGEFYSVALTNNRQQADTGTKMIHMGRNTRSTIISKGISAGRSSNAYRGLVRTTPTAIRRAQLHPVRLAADRWRLRRPHLPLHRKPLPERRHRTRGDHLQGQRRPAVPVPAARHRRREGGEHDRQRFLQGRVPGAAHGVRRGGRQAARGEPGRCRRMKFSKSKTCTSTSKEKPILRGVDLDINAGEVHAIMGPNGSGKSTLAAVLAGRPGYELVDGEMRLLGQDLASLEPEARAHLGLFLAFQYPGGDSRGQQHGVPQGSLDSHHAAPGRPQLSAVDFMKHVRALARTLDLSPEFLKRGVNEGFSGGEKKRNEILQMLLLEPRLAVLDETDSGLDIDALQVVARGVNGFRRDDNGVLLITHYQRLLDHIVPDVVHVLSGGRIVRSGDRSLALKLEEEGYGWLAS
jgi:FeS assembly ATPase SufC